jgi:hypothetical protein
MPARCLTELRPHNIAAFSELERAFRIRNADNAGAIAPSRWTIKSIASDTALILPHRPNPLARIFGNDRASEVEVLCYFLGPFSRHSTFRIL